MGQKAHLEYSCPNGYLLLVQRVTLVNLIDYWVDYPIIYAMKFLMKISFSNNVLKINILNHYSCSYLYWYIHCF